MTDSETELVQEAGWFCRFVCCHEDGRCSIEQPDQAGERCPLWRFVQRDKSTLKPPPWMENLS